MARNPERLQAAAVRIGELNGGRVHTVPVDVRDYATLATGIAEVVALTGPLDVVVAGAAGNFPAPAASMSANAFAAVVGIDLLGTFNTWRACFAQLRTPGARLLAISAPQATQPMPLQAHACAAKAGIEQLVRTLALEWAPAGVRVNAISPGFVADTVGGNILGDADSTARMIASLPVPRWLEVDEIAQLALFLVSPASSGMTGQILALDGGASLLGSGLLQGRTYS